MNGSRNGTKAISLLRKADRLLTLAWEPELNKITSKLRLRIKSKRSRSQFPPLKCKRMSKPTSLTTKVAGGNF